MDTQDKNIDFDNEPVVYCARCYSLKIKYEEEIDTDCCMDCGCTDTLTSSIEEWERRYEKRYGKSYITKESNPRNSPIFQLSIGDLKQKIFNNPDWEKIIRTIYRNFPKGYGKADSVLLFFDKLIKDKKLDDLRFLLLDQQKYKAKWKRRS